MLVLKIALVLPVMTAIASPVITVTKVTDIVKRVAAVAAQTTDRTAPLIPVPTEATTIAAGTCSGSFTCAGDAKHVFARAAEPTAVPAGIKREDSAGSVSEIIHARSEQPNIPEFIDTGACLCGLLADQDTLHPNNGGILEKWRCTADTTDNIEQGGNGKWYNTTLPSEEVSGFGEPRNFGANPPYTGMTYVLVFENGGATYELLNNANSGALHGDDYKCTGTNDTGASAQFYATQ